MGKHIVEVKNEIQQLMNQMKKIIAQLQNMGSTWNAICRDYLSLSDEDQLVIEDALGDDYRLLWSQLYEDNELGDWFF